MALSQLLSLGVIWLAAGRGGLRRETLRLAGPKPAWTTAAMAGLLLVVLSGGVELILYRLLGFDLFTDTRWLMDGLKGPAGWGVAFIAVGLAPLWEELTFRGFLLSALAKSPLGYWPAALISTGLWTLLHWSYSYAGLTSVFVAGLVLSWMMRRLGSMRVVVVAHALANTVALAVALAVRAGWLESTEPLWSGHAAVPRPHAPRANGRRQKNRSNGHRNPVDLRPPDAF